MTGKRRWTLLIALLVTLSCGITALARGERLREGERGWESAVDTTPPLPYRLPLAGVNVDLTQYSDDALHEHLSAMAARGIVWVRQFFPWSTIETEPGQYSWIDWDRLIEAVGNYPSLRLVAVLHTSPLWARHPDARLEATAPPANVGDFATFAAAFAARYGDSVDYYQIWDEPNLGAAWGGLTPSPAAYTALLQGCYGAIHAVDPTAMVIAAGLAPTVEQGPHNLSDVLYLERLYAEGAAPYFDAAAGKPYGFESPPDDRRVDNSLLSFSRIVLLREVMLRHNDGEKALWVSAFGWNALPSDWAGQPSIWGNVDRATQFAWIRAAYSRAATEWPWVAGLIVQHWQPDASPDDPLLGFSLVRPEESPSDLPSDIFGAVARDAAFPGRYSSLTEFATYHGEWEFGTLGADIGHAQDSELTFTFRGAAVALELRRDNYRGYLYVTVDGEPANALLKDISGQSYIILNASDNLPGVDVIPVAKGLDPASVHILRARAEYGWDQWALVGYRVATPFPGDSEKRLVLVLTAISIGSGVVFLYLAIRGRAPTIVTAKRHFLTPLSHTAELVVGLVASVLLMFGMALTWNDGLPALLRRDVPGLVAGLLTSGLVYLSDSLILTLVTGLLLWVLIFDRIELGLLLTILWLPFFLYPVTLYKYAVPVAEVCLLFTATAWMLRKGTAWARHHPPLGVSGRLPDISGLDWGLVALFGIATLSLAWSEYRDVAIREWRTMLFEPFLFYCIARTTIRTRSGIFRLLSAFVASAVLAALIGLVMYFSGQGVIIAEGASRRLAGVYGSPNNIGLYLGRALPFALVFILQSGSKWRRLLAVLASVVMIVAVVLSQSAGALLLGIPTSVFVLLFLWRRHFALIGAGIAAVGGLLAYIPLSQHPRFARLLDFSSGTVFFRLRVWESAWRMIKDHPLRGYGLDQFLYQYRGRYIFPDAWQEPNLSHPHNILLDFWTRLGLAGVAVLVWLQYSFWRTTGRLYRTLSRGDSLFYMTIAAMASMVDVLAHGLVDNSIFVIDLSFVFALLLVLPGLIATAADGTQASK